MAVMMMMIVMVMNEWMMKFASPCVLSSCLVALATVWQLPGCVTLAWSLSYTSGPIHCRQMSCGSSKLCFSPNGTPDYHFNFVNTLAIVDSWCERNVAHIQCNATCPSTFDHNNHTKWMCCFISRLTSSCFVLSEQRVRFSLLLCLVLRKLRCQLFLACMAATWSYHWSWKYSNELFSPCLTCAGCMVTSSRPSHWTS